ncbi:UPF0755 protein [Desulfacinum hydrothermale DSM 13146]|uniref:Endolytic murein transglycosylase n=1 Tax=Desulfacinum hydrothermale DSM 13146 TaxID=1121390 RepID=A0A1W1X5V1_9BACT|nr:endolytic transglycosylase MltG [Desulfacinum hydrothermale]SMC19098.1 UPF0755 protein [Desulfacinum hydrothermale DSM 13146]
MRRFVWLASLWLLLAVGSLGFLEVVRLWTFSLTPTPNLAPLEVEIQQGTNPRAIAALLESQGAISDARLFYWYARLQKAAGRLQAGTYRFPPLPTPRIILDALVHGKVIFYKITIPEGSGLEEIAELLEEKGLASQAEILRLCHDPAFLASLDLQEAPSLEGYIFPETYLFRKNTSPQNILRRMVQEFWRHFPESRKERARQLGMSIHAVVTLASLIEKEAMVDRERPVIASVFYNRLKKGMPLQSDPTAVYDLKSFRGPITREHLKRESPYNTYRHKGLPPGPICSPGEESIRAALYPAETSYLYFVSNGDGTHTFSARYRDHQRAVRRYRNHKQQSVPPPGKH